MSPTDIPVPSRATVIENPFGGAEVEAWLNRRGAHFLRCMAIPVELFDERASRNNQARAEAIVPEAVARYTVTLKDGEPLPPVVAYRPGKDARFVMVDGNNRLASHKAVGARTIPTYVLAPDTPTPLIMLLTVEANAKHGESVPLSWRIRQAADLNENGYDEETAASAAKITVYQLRHHKALRVIDDRVRPLRITGWLDLTETARHKLGQLKSDPVLMQAAHAAIQTEMTADDVKGMVRDLKALRSEREQFDRIAEISDERKVQMAQRKALKQTSHRIRNVQQSLVSAIGKILQVDTAAVMRLCLTDIERQQLWDRLGKCAEKILDLQANLETIMKGKEASG